jgi:predicted aspartyl protease
MVFGTEWLVWRAFGLGTVHARCRIENPIHRTKRATIAKSLVDTGREYTWVSGSLLERLAITREKKDVTFVMANGQQVTRSVGFAIIRLNKFFTIDEVVFGEPGDLALLGARTLEGLNLRVDSQRRTLVAAGPVPAAVPSRRVLRSTRPKKSRPRPV